MNLDELQAQLTAIQTENTQLKADRTAFESRATAAETALTAANAKVAGLEGQVTSLNAKVSELSTQLSTANENTANVQSAFDKFKEGEAGRIETAVAAKLPAALEEALKVELPKAAAAAGFRIPSPPAGRKDDPDDKRTPREKLEAAIAATLPKD